MTQIEGPVIVGVDGTPRSGAADTAAVDLGAWEAIRRRVALSLLVAGRAADPAPEDGSAGQATHLALDRIADRISLAHPDLTVTATQAPGGIAGSLVAAAATASLVIIAADARIHYGGLLAGLVSIQVAAHAQTPVIVVSTPTGRPPTPAAASAGTVIVGIDGSLGAHDAVAFAFDEAQARGATLRAIHVESTPSRHGSWPTGPARDLAGSPPPADTIGGDAVRLWQVKYPDVTVICDVIRADGPVRALNAAAGPADLIVVGARGAGGFATLALGSVSDGLVRYARCNVAVVPAEL